MVYMVCYLAPHGGLTVQYIFNSESEALDYVKNAHFKDSSLEGTRFFIIPTKEAFAGK